MKMSNQTIDDHVFEAVVMALLQRPVAFYPVFADIAGTTDAGIMLSQAWYWTQRLPPERQGWFYKSWQEWKEETSLGRRQQDTAKAKLKEKGLIETTRKGLDPTLHFRINRENFISALKSLCTNPCIGLHKSVQGDAQKSATLSTKPGTVHAEITTENTSQITRESSSAPAAETLPEDSPIKPVSESKTASPAQPKGKGKKAAPDKQDDEGQGPGNWQAPYIEAFLEYHEAVWEMGYKWSGRDGKGLKEALATHKDRFTIEAWQRACIHYFQSPARPKHTGWHLADNFVVYYKGSTDKFGHLLETEKQHAKPETRNATKQSHGERAAANTFAVFAQSAESWPADGIEGTGPADGPIIDVGPDARFD